MAYDAANERVVLYGGVVWDATESAWIHYQDTWEYDGTSWTEATPTTSPTGLEEHALAYDPGREVVVLFGGMTESLYFDATWEYNGATWVERTLTPRPVARGRHALSFAGPHGGLVLFGGVMNDYPYYPSDTWVYWGDSSVPDELCGNGTDDDLDGLVDCADPDCDGRPCASGHCVAGACQ